MAARNSRASVAPASGRLRQSHSLTGRSTSRSGGTPPTFTPRRSSPTRSCAARSRQNALVRIGEYVAEHGLDGDGPYLAARDLLLRAPPRLGGAAIREPGETTLQAAIRLCDHLDGGILPIQGPPGAGKTFTGARMICELVRRGQDGRHHGKQPQGHPQPDRRDDQGSR